MFGRLGIASWVLLLALPLGCNTTRVESLSGTILSGAPAVQIGAPAPDVNFADAQGHKRTLSSVLDDAAILVFTTGGCADTVTKLRNEGIVPARDVTVVLICSCGRCRASAQRCPHKCDVTAPGMVTLRDPDQILHQRYGVSENTTAFVLDNDQTIVATGALREIDRLARQAQAAAYQAQVARNDLYGG